MSKTNMKKVFLYAYDRRNLGDDLFVHTIVKRYPDTRFYMWSDKTNQTTFQSLHNLKVMDKDSVFVQLLKRIRPSFVSRYRAWMESRCQAVVYIGGSIFMEYENWKQILNWWEYEAENRPLYIMGANFGPYRSEAFRNKLAEIFCSSRDVCFRDQYSYKKFCKIPTVRYAPDILFSYPVEKTDVIHKQIFVSPIDCSTRGEGEHTLSAYSDNYFSTLRRLLNNYLEDGYCLVLASFCSEEGDDQAVKKLLGALSLTEDDHRVKCLFYDGTNIKDMLAGISSSEYVIATRFHAAILALVTGRPVFPIVYSDKTINVLQDIGFRGNYADLRDLEPISYEYSKFNLEHSQNIDAEHLARMAEGHFSMLDQCLNPKAFW